MFRQGAYLFLMLAASAWAAPQVVKTQHATHDVVIACEVFEPPKESGTDAVPALQAVIDKVSRAGGGTVFLPAGAYTIASRVTVREGVTLRGDWDAYHATNSTLLKITADRIAL